MTDSLFTTPRETSRAAALAARVTAGSKRQRIYEFIELRGEYGATDEEIQIALGMDGSTARPRRLELADEGRIVMTGNVRRTSRGRNAVVWCTTGGTR